MRSPREARFASHGTCSDVLTCIVNVFGRFSHFGCSLAITNPEPHIARAVRNPVNFELRGLELRKTEKEQELEVANRLLRHWQRIGWGHAKLGIAV